MTVGRGSGQETIIQFGQIGFTVDYGAMTVSAYVTAPLGVAHSLGSAAVSDWAFIYLRKTANSANFGFGALGVAVSESAGLGDLASNSGVDSLTILAAKGDYWLRDLRIWQTQKSVADMDLIRNYLPLETIVPYTVGSVQALNDNDRYGLRLLANGWLAADKMPAWVRTPKAARLVRYNGQGEFVGEPWRKQTGLGGGQIPPPTWQLGDQYYSMTATGTLVVSPDVSPIPRK